MKSFCCSLLLLFSSGIYLTAQNIAEPIGIKIKNLPAQQEFSAMAWKGNDSLFIIAQRNTDSFFYVKKDRIQASLDSSKELELQSVPVLGLTKFANSLKKSKDGKYDGIEACVFIGNKVFISIETPGNVCYILQGKYDGVSFIFDSKDCVTLPKPYKCNYGYENMVRLSDGRILAIFEGAKDFIHHAGYVFTEKMNDTIRTFVFCDSYRKNNGRELRLADVCNYKGGLLAIDLERDTNNNNCVSRIVSLTDKGNSFSADVIANLNYDMPKSKAMIKCVNFEGIAEFGDGILVISDNNPPKNNGTTYLYYYKLK